MKKISGFTGILRAHAVKLPAFANRGMRWHNILTALVVFTLLLGLVRQTPPAQAAPVATEFRFFLIARKLSGDATICIGDDVPIHVKVMRAEVVGEPANLGYAQALPGVRVDASVSNGEVGALTRTTINTGSDSSDPGGADFVFHATKAGTTSIDFTGTINHIWWASKYLIGLPPSTDRKDVVNNQVGMTVEECQYKVTVISTFSTPGAAIMAEIIDARLKMDPDGRFTGTATVDWIGGPVTMFNCNGTMQVAPSQAELVGVQGTDQLVLEVAYSETSLTHIYDCNPGSVEIHPTEQPDPIIVIVPLSGGSKFVEDQKLICSLPNCEAWNFTGVAKVVVTRLVQH